MLFVSSSRDEQGRWKGAVVAIDAIPFNKTKPQFDIESIRRELNKVSAFLFMFVSFISSFEFVFDLIMHISSTVGVEEVGS